MCYKLLMQYATCVKGKQHSLILCVCNKWMESLLENCKRTFLEFLIASQGYATS